MSSVTASNRSDTPWRLIAPGVFTWKAFHREWGEDVRSAVYLSPRSVVLIDPLVPSGRAGASFWKELDRLILTEGFLLQIILTVFWHERSVPTITARYRERTRVWCPAGGGALSITARRFRPGVRLPAGIQALRTERKYEVLLWIARARTLFSGDVILGGKRSPLRLCPGSWLPEGVLRAELADSLEPILDLPVDVVHVGHGSPVISGTREALASALNAARGQRQEGQ